MAATFKEKDKAKVGDNSKLNISRLHLFSCHEALSRHISFVFKNCHTPRGFHKNSLLAHPQIRCKIKTLGWENLCNPSCSFNIDWVRDFYTELSVTNGVELLVRQTHPR